MFYFALQVYDVTKFLEHHPGGDDVLISASGIEFLGLIYFSNRRFEFHINWWFLP
jgi:hypothetical protein